MGRTTFDVFALSWLDILYAGSSSGSSANRHTESSSSASRLPLPPLATVRRCAARRPRWPRRSAVSQRVGSSVPDATPHRMNQSAQRWCPTAVRAAHATTYPRITFYTARLCGRAGRLTARKTVGSGPGAVAGMGLSAVRPPPSRPRQLAHHHLVTQHYHHLAVTITVTATLASTPCKAQRLPGGCSYSRHVRIVGTSL